MEGEVLRFDTNKRHPHKERKLLLGQRELVEGNLILVRSTNSRSSVYSVPRDPDWRTGEDTATLMDEVRQHRLVSVGICILMQSGVRFQSSYATFLADDVSQLGPIEFQKPIAVRGKLMLSNVELKTDDRLLVKWPNNDVTLQRFFFAGTRIGGGPRFWIEVNVRGYSTQIPLGSSSPLKIFLLPQG